MPAKVLFAGFFALYPFAIYFAVREGHFRTVAAVLFVCGVLKLLGRREGNWPAVLAAIAAVLIAAMALLFESKTALLLYPAGINLSLMGAFLCSLFSPPSAIEIVARISEKNLPAAAVAYCTQVTRVWCVVFFVNALLAIFTARWCSLWWWSLWNGLLSYFFIALVFGIELLVRRRFRARLSA